MSLRDKIIEKMRAADAASGLRPSGRTPLYPEDYEAFADAALAALRPHDAVQDSKPLILYFPTDEDRDEFIKVVYAAKPDMRSVKV